MTKDNPYIEKIKDHKYINQNLELLPEYKWRWNEYFGNNNPLRLEIWTGLWNFFSGEVPKFSNRNFLGMEIKFKRCYVTAEKTLAKWGENFLIIREFAQKIDSFIWDWELEQTYIFFPDPWGKKDRQKKHRLMQADFLETLFKKTQSGWKVIFKTDHRDYFKDSLEVIENQNIWEIQNLSFDYENENPDFDINNITEFEAIHREHKTQINYLELVKK